MREQPIREPAFYLYSIVEFPWTEETHDSESTVSPPSVLIKILLSVTKVTKIKLENNIWSIIVWIIYKKDTKTESRFLNNREGKVVKKISSRCREKKFI